MKPKWTPTKTYILFILLACGVLVTGAWLENWKVVSTAAAVAMVFVSLQLGSVFNQYAGIIQLVQILNSLIIASLKAQGFEIEGQTPTQETETSST